MKRRNEVTQGHLKECVDYDPETGIFTWLHRPRSHFATDHGWHTFLAQHAGKEAGNLSPSGYRRIYLKGYTYLAQRLAFLYMTGRFSEHDIDHINRVRNDNRWDNLREITHLHNCWNAPMRTNNTSGQTGVWRNRRKNKWAAGIEVNKSIKFLGYFESYDDAVKARQDAEKEYFRIEPLAPLRVRQEAPLAWDDMESFA